MGDTPSQLEQHLAKSAWILEEETKTEKPSPKGLFTEFRKEDTLAVFRSSKTMKPSRQS
jgi:hypothetical protein